MILTSSSSSPSASSSLLSSPALPFLPVFCLSPCFSPTYKHCSSDKTTTSDIITHRVFCRRLRRRLLLLHQHGAPRTPPVAASRLLGALPLVLRNLGFRLTRWQLVELVGGCLKRAHDTLVVQRTLFCQDTHLRLVLRDLAFWLTRWYLVGLVDGCL